MKISAGVSALNVMELILTHGSKERMLTFTNRQLTITGRSIKKCKSRRGPENNTLALKPVEPTGHRKAVVLTQQEMFLGGRMVVDNNGTFPAAGHTLIEKLVERA